MHTSWMCNHIAAVEAGLTHFTSHVSQHYTQQETSHLADAIASQLTITTTSKSNTTTLIVITM